MDKFNALYTQLICEAEADINYKEAMNLVYNHNADPKELHDLLVKVKDKLDNDPGHATSKLVGILITLANNKNLDPQDFLTLANEGGYIEEQLYYSLPEKNLPKQDPIHHAVPEEIIDKQEEWIKKYKKNITPYREILKKTN